MAATKLIAMHQNKGRSVMRCLKDRTDYAINGEKTDEGKYISSYQCNPELVDLEFAQAKKEYLHKTWRQPKGDVIAYQIRQSFKPGEITPEEANEVGYETGMRFTKGKHAFIVATHVDRAHIHNHIIFNSTHKVRAQLVIEDDILRGLGMCLQQAKCARVRTGALLANLRSNNDCGLKEPLF